MQMLREKYWFPDMNKMTKRVVENCYECQLTTKQYRQEPVKMTRYQKNHGRSCQLILGGLYPDGHYNLVVIDKRTRYPKVEAVHSTEKSQLKKS